MFGFIAAAVRAIRDRIEQRGFSISNTDFSNIFNGFGGRATSGAAVTPETALGLNAVYCCVRVIADGIAMLPLPVYRRLKPRGKEEAREHPLWSVLHDSPNPWMTSYTFRQTMAGWAVRSGNAYAEIIRNGAGQVAQLWPIPSTMVTPIITSDMELLYDVRVPGVARTQRLPRERVFHWRGLSQDGVVGLDPITVARETFGLGLAAAEYQSRFFGNGSRPGGVIQVDGVLGVEGRARLKAGWELAQGGLSNAHRVAVLENGAKWTQMGLSPEDSQLLETQRDARRWIAAIFGVPLHMIADIENASYATVEQQDINFAVHCLAPRLESFEAELALQIFTERDRDTYFAEHKMSALMRGSFDQRNNGYRIGHDGGWYSADDIREMENLNPLPEGRGADYFAPLNMVAIPAGGLAGLSPKPMTVEPGETSPGDGSKPAPPPKALPGAPPDGQPTA